MNGGGNRSLLGFVGLLGLCGLCCAAPLLLAGGGAAAVSGYFADNLWGFLAGAAAVIGGLFLLKSRGRGSGERDDS